MEVVEYARQVLEEHNRKGPLICKGMDPKLKGMWFLVINNTLYGVCYPCTCNKANCGGRVWRGTEQQLLESSLHIGSLTVENVDDAAGWLFKRVETESVAPVSYSTFEKETGLDLVDLLIDWRRRQEEKKKVASESKGRN